MPNPWESVPESQRINPSPNPWESVPKEMRTEEAPVIESAAEKTSLGSKVMNAPLSPALGFLNKYVSDKIPNPTLANVVQGFKEGVGSALKGAVGGLDSGLSINESPTVKEFYQTEDPARRRVLRAQMIEESKAKRAQREEQYQNMTRSRRAKYQQESSPDVVGEFLGQSIPYAAMSLGLPGGNPTGALVDRYAANAANAAITSGVLSPGDIQEKAKAAVSAGVLTPTIQGVTQLVGKGLGLGWTKGKAAWEAYKAGKAPVETLDSVIAQAKNAGFNSVDDIATASNTGDKTALALNEKMLKASAAEENIPAYAPDYSQNVKMQNRAIGLEKQPGVMMDARQIQGQAITKSIGERVKGQKEKAMAVPFESREAIEAASQGPAGVRDRYAVRVKDFMNKAGDDHERNIQASLMSKEWEARQAAKKEYDAIGEMVKGRGDVEVEAPFDWAIRVLEEHGPHGTNQMPNKALAKEATEVAENLAADWKPKDYNNLRRLRSRAGAKAEEYAAKGDNETAAALGDLRDYIGDELDNWAIKQNIPGLTKAVKHANETYAKAKQYSDYGAGLSRIENAIDPDKAMGPLTGKSYDQFKRTYEALDPRGQEHAKALLISTAAEKAKTDKGISPAQFSSYLKDRAENLGVAFEGRDKWALDGMNNLLRHAQRAGQYAENPATGERGAQQMMNFMKVGEVMGAGLAAASGHPQAALGLAVHPVAMWARGNILSRLYTTEAGKAFLVKASSLKPGSPAMQKLTEQLPKLISMDVASPAEPTQEQP